MKRLTDRFRRLFATRADRELDEELRYHVDAAIGRNVERGMHPEEARRQALIAFGGVQKAKEEVRAEQRFQLAEQFLQDTHYAFRQFRRSPGFTVVIIVTLALGIGANTAIFSLVNALMFKPLPVEKPEELVLFGDGSHRGVITGIEGRYNIFSYPLYERLRDIAAFEGVCAFRTQLDRLSLRVQGSDDAARLAWGRLVSGNYFALLGIKPAAGRLLAAEDDRPGAAPVAVISYDYWKTAFQFAPSTVGQAVVINGTPFAIVGVAARGFFGESVESQVADVWVPITAQPRVMAQRPLLAAPNLHWTNLIGRLEPGATLERAQAEANVVLQQFLRETEGAAVSAEREEELRRSQIVLSPGGAGVSAPRASYARPLQILLAVVGLVLLIACANVANVLLARSAARQKEVSTRLALGAGRGRLIRQFLTESLLLAGIGGAVGVVFAYWGAGLLVAMVSADPRPIPVEIAPDARILAFTLLISVVTGVLFGLVPAVRATRVELTSTLRADATLMGFRSRWRLAKGLVVFQVAVSLPLLVGAGLFLRTLQQLHKQDLGFNREHVLEAGIDPRIAGYQTPQLAALYEALLARVAALPGVRSASVSLYSPMSGDNWSGPVSVEGYTAPSKDGAFTQWVYVGPRYAETVGMTLLLGRDTVPADLQSPRKIAVVNETFVRRYLAGTNPIGRRLAFGGTAANPDVEIVGVVKDVKFNNPRQNHWPIAFVPLTQAPMPVASYARYLEVRSAGPPADMAAAVRAAIQEVDRNVPVTGMRTLAAQVNDSLNQERLMAAVCGFFALLALLLASIGLYGVLAYIVAGRSREIGIRVALGARRADVLALVLGQGGVLIGAGLAAGLGGALAVTRLVRSLLYATDPYDVLTYGVVAGLLVAVALLATYIPARRAARVDPITVLRYE